MKNFIDHFRADFYSQANILCGSVLLIKKKKKRECVCYKIIVEFNYWAGSCCRVAKLDMLLWIRSNWKSRITLNNGLILKTLLQILGCYMLLQLVKLCESFTSHMCTHYY